MDEIRVLQAKLLSFAILESMSEVAYSANSPLQPTRIFFLRVFDLLSKVYVTFVVIRPPVHAYQQLNIRSYRLLCNRRSHFHNADMMLFNSI